MKKNPCLCNDCKATEQIKRVCYYGFICHKNGMPPMAAGLYKIGKGK